MIIYAMLFRRWKYKICVRLASHRGWANSRAEPEGVGIEMRIRVASLPPAMFHLNIGQFRGHEFMKCHAMTYVRIEIRVIAGRCTICFLSFLFFSCFWRCAFVYKLHDLSFVSGHLFSMSQEKKKTNDYRNVCSRWRARHYGEEHGEIWVTL